MCGHRRLAETPGFQIQVKRLLIDTNVVLDILLDRQPHVEASAAIWSVIEAGKAAGFIAAHAVTTVYYLAQRELGANGARRVVDAILRVLVVAAVDGSVIQDALAVPLADFEDAVTVSAVHSAGCDYIVTRNLKDYRRSHVPCLTPESAVAILASGS